MVLTLFHIPLCAPLVKSQKFKIRQTLNFEPLTLNLSSAQFL
jgi:hypothetical protein